MTQYELMISDWMLDGDNVAQITGITCDGIIETTVNETSNIEAIQPIPLTPEILEKNGFTFNKEETNSSIQDVYENYTKFFDFPLGKGFYIEYDTVKKVFHITDHCWIIFKYVHELQHVLRLCNIDKEIVL